MATTHAVAAPRSSGVLSAGLILRKIFMNPEKIRQIDESVERVQTPFEVIEFRRLRAAKDGHLWNMNCL